MLSIWSCRSRFPSTVVTFVVVTTQGRRRSSSLTVGRRRSSLPTVVIIARRGSSLLAVVASGFSPSPPVCSFHSREFVFWGCSHLHFSFCSTGNPFVPYVNPYVSFGTTVEIFYQHLGLCFMWNFFYKPFYSLFFFYLHLCYFLFWNFVVNWN